MKAEFSLTRMSLRTRFIIAFMCYALSGLLMFLSIIYPQYKISFVVFLVYALLFVPIPFLKTVNFPGKQKSVSGSKKKDSKSGVWKPVTMTQMDRMVDSVNSLKKMKIPLLFKASFGVLSTIAFFVIFLFTNGSITTMVVLFYIILFPLLWFTRVKKTSPYSSIVEKMKIFNPLLGATLPVHFRLEPMLFFKGGEGDEIPSDIRVMLAPGPDASQKIRDELLGVQFQLTYNSGPNGKVPYAYAVFITKGQGKLWETFKVFKFPGLITEPGSSKEGDTVYGTVVLRQDTKKRSDGYHTKPGDVKSLVSSVMSAFSQ